MRGQNRQQGFTMIEILIAMFIFAIGLLAMAGLQSKMQVTEVESYQRAQAAVLLQDMVNRMLANTNNADSYVLGTGATLGTGTYYGYNNCTPANYPNIKDRDHCDWSNRLAGQVEYSSTTGWRDSLIDARGCIQQVQAADNTPGVCQPAIYRISIAWQGLVETVGPSATLSCAANQYGDEKYRRVLSTTVTMGLPRCTS